MVLGHQDDIEVVAEAGTGVEAIEAARTHRPDVILMDIRMPEMDGLEATSRIVEEADWPVRILILTTFDPDEYVYQALRAGASGFVLKDIPPEELVAAVHTVADGGALLAPSITKRLIGQFAEHLAVDTALSGRLELLTDQEREVLATGGVNIAGDVFDREIIRYRLLDHFGRGTRLGERGLPFPVHLTEALAHWQEIPTLSTPRTLRLLDEAQRTGNHPSRVRALESLVVNNFGFAMFDAVEQAKQELSDAYSTVLRLWAKDIDLWQLLTRAQFESVIAQHRRAIAARVQDTMERSGLGPDEIDAVVRTGGSSQIPCFISLLAEHFGAEKLRLENTFSGVTAGLAIRAWELDNAQSKRT